jgi:hypothetical protein
MGDKSAYTAAYALRVCRARSDALAALSSSSGQTAPFEIDEITIAQLHAALGKGPAHMPFAGRSVSTENRSP